MIPQSPSFQVFSCCALALVPSESNDFDTQIDRPASKFKKPPEIGTSSLFLYSGTVTSIFGSLSTRVKSRDYQMDPSGAFGQRNPFIQILFFQL